MSISGGSVTQLATIVFSPAGDGAVVEDRARVVVASRDRHGRPASTKAGRLGGRVSISGGSVTQLAVLVTSPAGDGAVVED